MWVNGSVSKKELDNVNQRTDLQKTNRMTRGMFLLGLRVSPAVIPRLSVPPSVVPAWFDLDNDGRIDETRDEKEAVVSICKCAARDDRKEKGKGKMGERRRHTQAKLAVTNTRAKPPKPFTKGAPGIDQLWKPI